MYASAQKFSYFKAYLTFLSTANTAKSMPHLSLFTLLRHIFPLSTHSAIPIAPSATQSKASRSPQHTQRHQKRPNARIIHITAPKAPETPRNSPLPQSVNSSPSLPQILLKLSLYPLHGIICGFLISAKNGGDFFYRHSRNV